MSFFSTVHSQIICVSVGLMTEEEATARNPNRGKSQEEIEATSSGTLIDFSPLSGVLSLHGYPHCSVNFSEESIDTKIAKSNSSVAVNPILGGEIYEGHVKTALRTRHLALRYMVSTPDTLLLRFPIVKVTPSVYA